MLAILFGMVLLYMGFLFTKYIPHFLITIYFLLPLFYSLTGLSRIPLATIFLLLFGPLVFIRASFLSMRMVVAIFLYIMLTIMICFLHGQSLWYYKAIFSQILLAMICYFSIGVKDSERSIRLFVYVIVIWILINAIFSILQFTLGESFYIISDNRAIEVGGLKRGYGLIGMATQVGIAFSLGVPLLMVLALTSTRHKMFMYMMLGIGLAGLILSFSRGAILGTYIGIYFILKYLKKRKLRLLYVIITVVLLVGYSGFMMFLPAKYITHFKGEDKSAMGRMTYVKMGLKMFKNKPLTGFGQDGFTNNVVKYGAPGPIEAHNTYIQVLVDQGLLGFILFMMIVFSSLKGCLYYIKKGTSDIIKNVSIGFLGSLIAILFDAIFHSFEWNIELWIAILMGFCVRFIAEKEKVNPSEVIMETGFLDNRA